jgi:LemA protein
MDAPLLIISLVIISLFLLIVGGWIIGMFNSLVRLRNNIQKSWANIDVLLKQRADEIPNLVSAVKGYMQHEKTVLGEVVKARADALGARTLSQKAAADQRMQAGLKSLFAVAENYPQLRASENFLALQKRISALEDQIADRREFYNDSVTTYNTRIESFPDMFIANMFSFGKHEMFEATAAERQVRKIDIA